VSLCSRTGQEKRDRARPFSFSQTPDQLARTGTQVHAQARNGYSTALPTDKRRAATVGKQPCSRSFLLLVRSSIDGKETAWPLCLRADPLVPTRRRQPTRGRRRSSQHSTTHVRWQALVLHSGLTCKQLEIAGSIHETAWSPTAQTCKCGTTEMDSKYQKHALLLD
jgi:hypothetical protein